MREILSTVSGLGVLALALVGLGVMGKTVLSLYSNLFHYSLGLGIGNPGNPIPQEKREELERRYGNWAVRIAEATCPEGDLSCIEMEAKRLLERRLSRTHPEITLKRMRMQARSRKAR
jgi:hypothetical protein